MVEPATALWKHTAPKLGIEKKTDRSKTNKNGGKKLMQPSGGIQYKCTESKGKRGEELSTSWLSPHLKRFKCKCKRSKSIAAELRDCLESLEPQ